MKNKIIRGLLCAMTTMFLAGITIPCYAMELEEKAFSQVYQSDEQGVSQEFINYIDDCFSDINNILVLDSEGNNISKNQLNNLIIMYDNKEYINISNYLLNNTYSLCHLYYTSYTRAFSSKAVKGYIYHLQYDTTKKYKKEWAVYVKGNYTYNDNTYEITKAWNSSLELYQANFGLYFSPYVSNVSTSAKVSSDKSKVTFSATYKMKATLSYDLVNTTLDFGTHTDKFTISVGKTPEPQYK